MLSNLNKLIARDIISQLIQYDEEQKVIRFRIPLWNLFRYWTPAKGNFTETCLKVFIEVSGPMNIPPTHSLLGNEAIS